MQIMFDDTYTYIFFKFDFYILQGDLFYIPHSLVFNLFIQFWKTVFFQYLVKKSKIYHLRINSIVLKTFKAVYHPNLKQYRACKFRCNMNIRHGFCFPT